MSGVSTPPGALPVPVTIPNLPAATTPVSGSDLLVISQSGVAKEVSVTEFFTGGPYQIALASPPAIGATAPNAGAFTTLSATSTISGAGFTAWAASPPAIGGTTPAAGTFTTIAGNASDATATATGANTALTFANRFALSASVIDFGADSTGVKDSTTAIQEAATAAGTNGVVLLDAGTYQTTSAVTGADRAYFLKGVTLSTPSDVPGTVDTSVYGVAPLITQGAFDVAGSATSGSANQFLQVFSAVSDATTAAADYEKAVVYVVAQQNDVSGANTKDLVGVESHASLGAANTEGRVWGYHAMFSVPSGADGMAIGIEVESVNNGVSTTDPTSPFQKIGVHVVADGPTASSFAFKVETGGTGGTYNAGLWFQPTSLTATGTAIVVPNDCSINGWDTNGTTQIGLVALSTANQVVLGTGGYELVAATNLLPSADNAYSFGDSAYRWTAIWAVNGTIQTSMAELKTDIETLPDMLPVVLGLHPRTYRWKVGGYDANVHHPADKAQPRQTPTVSLTERPGKRTHWGFIAAEVRDALASTGRDFGGYVKGDDGVEGIRPDQLLSVLWKAVQELAAEVQDLKQRNANAEAG